MKGGATRMSAWLSAGFRAFRQPTLFACMPEWNVQ